jgi:hypothetical protein
MDNSSSETSSVLDNTAVVLSGLCLVHCLLLPFIVGALPFLGQFGSGHLHLQMLVIVLPVSSIALALGFRKHENWHIIGWGSLGMLLLVVGGTIAHGYYGLMADRLFTIVGALMLAVTHYYNNRLSRGCRSTKNF